METPDFRACKSDPAAAARAILQTVEARYTRATVDFALGLCAGLASHNKPANVHFHLIHDAALLWAKKEPALAFAALSRIRTYAMAELGGGLHAA